MLLQYYFNGASSGTLELNVFIHAYGHENDLKSKQNTINGAIDSIRDMDSSTLMILLLMPTQFWGTWGRKSH